jgi:hypothetical protein
MSNRVVLTVLAVLSIFSVTSNALAEEKSCTQLWQECENQCKKVDGDYWVYCGNLLLLGGIGGIDCMYQYSGVVTTCYKLCDQSFNVCLKLNYPSGSYGGSGDWGTD